MLLLLLYAPGSSGQRCEPIRGKTRLQKEVFLTQKNLREAGVFTYYPFRPYNLGPYSKELYDDIEWMQYEGVLEIKKLDLDDFGICAEFRITKNGVREIEKKVKKQKLERAYEIAVETKRRFNAMNVVDLVKFTHSLYPEYVGQQRY